ncbi:MAG: RnfABCDGE type electron transport complex subunit D [Candidatus Aphodosoma sp.]
MLTLSPAPHIHSGDSVSRRMSNVVIALIPAYLASLYYFGFGALCVSIISIVSCLLFEYLIQRFILKGENTLGNMSALVTGMLLSFNLPSNLPWWIVVIGALAAIGVGKMTFGGLGNNPFNPALVGRVFLLISFPAQMTTWPRPIPVNLDFNYFDAESGATTLSIIKEGLPDKMSTYLDMLYGSTGGSLGEVSALALLIGFVYLLATRTISWHIPVSILATVTVFTGVFWLTDSISFVDGTMQYSYSRIYADPLVHLLSGGMLLGAIFMATDYVTSPMTHCGQVIYGIGIGIITCVIRLWGAYPEGMSFAILIMNAATPLINNYIKPRRYGEKIKQAKA